MARDNFSPYHEEWAQYGVCRSVGVEGFFPKQGIEWRQARRVCQGCPVRLLCEDYVMRSELGTDLKFRFGVWAGMGPLQRFKYEPTWLEITAEEGAA